MSQNTQKARRLSKSSFKIQYSIGMNSSKAYEIAHDAQVLAQHIVTYMQNKDPNYQFIDFYDPVLIKAMRNLIKNQKAFRAFLDTISFSIEEFFEIGVYVIPHVFTSYLIRFIKVTYLGQEVQLKPRKKKK